MKTVYLDSCSRKIKSCWLCNINEHRLLKTNYCISSINEKMFRDKPTKQIHNWTHSQQQKKKKMKFESLFWNYVKWNWRCVPVLMMWTEQSLFWNYAKWNRRYVSVLCMKTLCEHFLGYSLLYDFSAVQRLEAAV